uniref:SMODS and SLOG-associating 2TM effector domain-containing protein n=1 Tax=Streptomyces sp. NBC_00049 TaxID=2903617 RepID=A0AAU2JJ13_9ACTN
MAVLDTLVPFAPFFVPVVTGLVGGISLLVRDRREARSTDHRYRRRLEKAQLEVQFLSGWIQAKELAPTDFPAQAAAPEPGRWLDECYASVRRAKADTGGRHRTGPVSLRRLLLLGEARGPAATMRVVYWISLALFNVALAWWLNALIAGVPGFMHEEGASESDEIASYLGAAGVLFAVSAALWAWTVHLGAAEPEQVYRKRIDSAAWVEQEEKRRNAARAKADAKAPPKGDADGNGDGDEKGDGGASAG